MYGYVVHVDCNIPFIDKVIEYGVYHCLEGGQWVGQSKKHDCGFVQPLIGYKGHLPLIPIFNEDFIVSPFNVEPCEQCAVL